MKSQSVVRNIALANFIASFGGGTLLGKAMGVLVHEPLLKGDSLMALLVGGSLVVLINPLLSGRRVGELFAFGAALLSLVALWLVRGYADASLHLVGVPAWLFFFVLCFRFTFYFVARTQRADKASGAQNMISWVEMSFYLGMVLGLAVWNSGLLALTLPQALVVDALLQLVSGVLDWSAGSTKQAPAAADAAPVPVRLVDKRSMVYLFGALVLLTVGNQIVQFAFAHWVHALGRNGFLAPGILAACYAGGGASAFFCAFWKLSWRQTDPEQRALGAVTFSYKERELVLPFSMVIGASALTLVGTMWAYESGYVGPIAVLVGIVVSTFCLELSLLAILERIAEWARLAGRKGLVSMAISFMCLSGALGLAAFNTFAKTPSHLVVAVAAAYALTFFLLADRKATSRPVPKVLPTSRLI